MRLAGFNTGVVNGEPLNGQGIYQSFSSQAVAWDVANAMAAPGTVSVLWDTWQFAAASVSSLWDDYQFASATVAALWDDWQFATNQSAALWDVTGGVINLLSVGWSIPIAPRMPSSISNAELSSSITRHLNTSALSGGAVTGAISRHLQTESISEH